MSLKMSLKLSYSFILGKSIVLKSVYIVDLYMIVTKRGKLIKKGSIPVLGTSNPLNIIDNQRVLFLTCLFLVTFSRLFPIVLTRK